MVFEDAQHRALADAVADHKLGARSAGLVGGHQLGDHLGPRRFWASWISGGFDRYAAYSGEMVDLGKSWEFRVTLHRLQERVDRDDR
jgi:hypothetical protein